MSSPRLFKQFFSVGGTDTITTINNVAGYTLPTSTITVNSTAGFNTGIINVISFINNTVQYQNNTVTYTGIAGSSFTGCTGGVGTVFNGTLVTQISSSPVLLNTTWTAPPGV
jgi:hypothetical protein